MGNSVIIRLNGDLAKLGVLIAAIVLTVPAPLTAADVGKITGSIAGIVRDNAGIPQMGATVVLFNSAERTIQKALTDEKGLFGFVSLNPDQYSVRVSLASFVPAVRHKIAVQPGMQSLLYINMASLFSSIELVYAAPGQGALMSDDWRWILRTATATRPVLRALPDTVSSSDSSEGAKTANAIFSDTRGVLNLSAGDAGTLGDLTTQPELGTAFALTTSLFQHNRLKFSGNVAHISGVGIPMAGFRTSYSRDGVGPEVSVTMREVYLPSRTGLATGQQDGVPVLRTMSLSSIDQFQLTGNLRLEYGMSLDSVSFLDRLNYFSPFARLSYELGKFGTLRIAYSSGAPPTALLTRSNDPDAALHEDLLALLLAPVISLHDDRAAVERTQNVEVGYEKKAGSRTYDLTAYREAVTNGTLTVSGADGEVSANDLLPDISSRSSVFNIGSYQRYGYAASVAQKLGDKVEVRASTGRGGVFTASTETLEAGSADDLRSHIHMSQRYWASVRVSGVAPVTGTRITSSL